MDDWMKRVEMTMAATERRAGRGRWPERGSALVLVLLILLALSAIGMVALKDVTRSIDQSGQFRARSNAQALADGATQFMAKRFGNNAQKYLGGMEHLQDLERRGSVNQTTGGYTDNSVGVERRGMTQSFQQIPGEPGSSDFNDVLTMSESGDIRESGLFYDGSHASFESREGGSQFRVVLRDTLSGFPLPGFDQDRYCFTRVVLAARGEIGDRSQDWTQPKQTGVGTGIFEAMVGPTQNCGSNG